MLFDEINFSKEIFQTNVQHFNELAEQLFHHQFKHNKTYNSYCNYLNIKPKDVFTLKQIPFLPASFFKTHKVLTGSDESETIFTSSSTSGQIPSKHYIKDIGVYEQSFIASFTHHYHPVESYMYLALLPSYLERKGSSLVWMADCFIKKSNYTDSGFYLYNFDELADKLTYAEQHKIPTILLGVTHALIDFAEQFPLELKHTIVMETGGMKGRKREMVREEVHQLLKNAFGTDAIHSEYGMTELLSQAYSKKGGIFTCPPHMQVFISDMLNPIEILPHQKTGIINIIDLANFHSCAFIQTSDIGRCFSDGSFEVLGRLDHSEMRGCNLMYL
jgi:hypothetical protein